MAWDAVSTAQPGIFSPNLQAVLPLHVTAGTKAIQLTGWTNIIGSGYTVDFGIGVYVDGVWSADYSPSANGLTVLTVPLDGAAHDVDIVSAFQNFHTPSTNVGNWISGYVGASLRTVAAPTRRIVVYGDSIASGAYGSPLPQLSWFARVRSVYPGRISGEMWGGRTLLGDTNGTNGGLANLTTLAARLVALVQQGGATTTRQMWLAMGFNDWNNPSMTAAAFATNLGTLLDAIHTADSTVQVFLQSILVTGNELATNGNGETPPSFRAAAVTAATGRAWVTYVNGLSLMAAGGLSADGIHPSVNGHASIFDGSGGFAGSTNIRTVLGI